MNYKISASAWRIGALVAAVLALAMYALPVAVPQAEGCESECAPDRKVMLCHYASEPGQADHYNLLEVDKHAVANNPNGHDEHDMDIIPPFDGYNGPGNSGWNSYPGKNWDENANYVVDGVLVACPEVKPEPKIDITAPATDGQTLVGVYTFEGEYVDADDTLDDMKWAIRDDCVTTDPAKTYAGNVGGFSTPFNWDGASFSSTIDMQSWADGDYCLVLNPQESSGPDLRGTRTFVLDNPEPQPTADLRVCKAIIDESGTAIDGSGVSTEFSVRITGPADFDETVKFSTALALDTDLVDDNGTDDDSECKVFADVAPGQYLYEAEQISGEGVWGAPLYHDYFTGTPLSISEFAELTVDGQPGDNDDADGVINLGKDQVRTLAIVNELQEVPVDNTCLIPTALGDDEPFELGTAPGSELTLHEILDANGYGDVDVIDDQKNYQLWETEDPETDWVTFTVTVLGKQAGNKQAFGYFEPGDAGSFVPVLEVGDHSGYSAPLKNVGDSVTVTVPALVAESMGFAMHSQGVGGEWYSEYSLSTDGEDNFAVYNPAENVYILAIEDQSEAQGSDNDHNDLVVLIDGIICEEDNNDIEIELCKKDVTGAPVMDWGMTLFNDEEQHTGDTEADDGCVSFMVSAEQGPWMAVEDAEQGWMLDSVLPEGGTLYYGDGQEAIGCTFFGNEIPNDLPDAMATQAIAKKDCLECQPVYRCTFVNEQEVVHACPWDESLISEDDGSFEDPKVTNGTLWQKIAESQLGAWIIEKVSDATETTLELHRGWKGNVAAHGEQYAELDGDHSTRISQEIATEEGAMYKLYWAFAPRHNIAAEENQLSVEVDGEEVDTEGPETGSAPLAQEDWTFGEYEFKADSDMTTVAFLDAGVDLTSDSYGTFLDDVRLCKTADPEDPWCSYAIQVIGYSDHAYNNEEEPEEVTSARRDLTALDSIASYLNPTGRETEWNASDFFTLGIEGYLEVMFTEYVAVDQAGPDIAIYEITGGGPLGQTDETIEVYVSQDGVTYHYIDNYEGDAMVDIAPAGLDYVKYVRVVDDSSGSSQGPATDGFDIDAIAILSGSCDDEPDPVDCEQNPDHPDCKDDGDGRVTYGSRSSSSSEEPAEDTTVDIGLIGGVTATSYPGAPNAGAGGASGGSTGMIPVALMLGLIGVLATRGALRNEI